MNADHAFNPSVFIRVHLWFLDWFVMPTETEELQNLADREYRWGFVTDIESDSAPPGLSEDTVRFISKKKDEPQWMLD